MLLSTAAYSKEIKVRVESGLKSVKLTGWGLVLTNFKSKNTLFSKYSVTLQQNQWVIKDLNNDSQAQLKAPFINVRGQNVMLNSKPVSKKLRLFQDEQQGISVVAELPLEDYMVGVLPSEMPASWPLEALKAQAVASRSYVLHQMKVSRSPHFHVESTVSDQVFRPIERQPNAYQLKSKILKAVRATQDQVLKEPKAQKVLKAFFHSDCGGHTETSQAVWGKAQTQGAVKDPYCPQSPYGRWQLKLTHKELTKRLLKGERFQSPVKLLNFHALDRSSSGRIKKVRLALSEGMTKDLNANEFRKRLGYGKLKSTKFKWAQQKGHWLFKGRGFGHGVGLCQWGTRHLAERGVPYKRILSHYYPKASLKTL